MNPIELVMKHMEQLPGGNWHLENQNKILVENVQSFLDIVQTAGFMSIIEPVWIYYGWAHVLLVNNGVYTINGSLLQSWLNGEPGIAWDSKWEVYA